MFNFLKKILTHIISMHWGERFVYIWAVALTLTLATIFALELPSLNIERFGISFAESIARAQENHFKKYGTFHCTGNMPVNYCPVLGIDARDNTSFKEFITNGNELSYIVRTFTALNTALGNASSTINVLGTPNSKIRPLPTRIPESDIGGFYIAAVPKESSNMGYYFGTLLGTLIGMIIGALTVTLLVYSLVGLILKVNKNKKFVLVGIITFLFRTTLFLFRNFEGYGVEYHPLIFFGAVFIDFISSATWTTIAIMRDKKKSAKSNI